MWRVARILSLGVALAAPAWAAPAGPRDGQWHELPPPRVWDASAARWRMPDDFWRVWAGRRGGLTWGSGSRYPPYAEVSEHDTFIVELDSGRCLMEFFHGRWRRAQDVRRWDDRFNDYSGCPDVFR